MDAKEILFLWFMIFFSKKPASLADKSASGGASKSMQNEQPANELHKTFY